MDSEDHSYLAYLNDTSESYLISDPEFVGNLQDAVPVQPIFTDIDSEDWNSGSFSVLLNDSLITSDNGVNIDNSSTEKNRTAVSREVIETVDEESQTNGVELSEDSTTSAMYITKDLLVQFASQNIQPSTLSNLDLQNNKSDNNIILYSNGNAFSISLESLGQTKSDHAALKNNVHLSNTSKKERDFITNNNNLNTEQTKLSISEEVIDSSDIYDDFFTSVTANKCKVCSALYETVNGINEHLRTEHGDLIKAKQAAEEKDAGLAKGIKMQSILNTNANSTEYTVFICSTCYTIFSNQELLKEHMIKEHDLVASSTTTSNTNQGNHGENKEKPKLSFQQLAKKLVDKQRKARKFKCTQCTGKFAEEEFLKIHEQCHLSENQKGFQCFHCKEKFSIWRICCKHLWNKHKVDSGLITCPMCNQMKSVSPVVIVHHMNTHNHERPYLCSDCGKAFKQNSQLRNHREVHKREQNGGTDSNCKCPVCGIFLANVKSLKKHKQSVHDKFKPYICNICEHQTSRKAMLELHLRQHTGHKPYQCSDCSFKTGDHNCLRKHMMRHAGETQYSCPHCTYKAIQSSAFKHHLEKQHPEQEICLKCPYCPFKSINSIAYWSHTKQHEINSKNEKGETQSNQSEQLNSQEKQNPRPDEEDDEVQEFLYGDEVIDRGGITIPAGLEMQLVS